MPDPIQMAEATGLAFTASALLLGLFAWWGRRRAAGPTWIDAGWVVGTGAGFYLGCWMLGVRPHWPPGEDMDRLLEIVVPSALAVELLSAFSRIPRWLIWTLRLVIAGCLARVLLDGSIYLSGSTEPGTLAWTPTMTWLILRLLEAALATSWVLMVLLARRSSAVTPVVGLAIAVGGSAITIMLSGYASGGQVGLPMAAALLGAASVALLTPGPARLTAPIGLAIVGLSSLLVIGRFFGELRTDHAILLFTAPLLAWLPELPVLRRLPPWGRGVIRVLLVGMLVLGVLADAGRRFAAGSGPAASGAAGDSGQYEEYVP
jgi:hypothetical protein